MSLLPFPACTVQSHCHAVTPVALPEGQAEVAFSRSFDYSPSLRLPAKQIYFHNKCSNLQSYSVLV